MKGMIPGLKVMFTDRLFVSSITMLLLAALFVDSIVYGFPPPGFRPTIGHGIVVAGYFVAVEIRWSPFRDKYAESKE